MFQPFSRNTFGYEFNVRKIVFSGHICSNRFILKTYREKIEAIERWWNIISCKAYQNLKVGVLAVNLLLQFSNNNAHGKVSVLVRIQSATLGSPARNHFP